MNYYFIFYIFSVISIIIPICKIIWYEKDDNDFKFLLLSNYILLFALSFTFDYKDMIFSLLLSTSLIVLSFLLIRKIKTIFSFYPLLSIPYFIFTIYTFSNILIFI